MKIRNDTEPSHFIKLCDELQKMEIDRERERERERETNGQETELSACNCNTGEKDHPHLHWAWHPSNRVVVRRAHAKKRILSRSAPVHLAVLVVRAAAVNAIALAEQLVSHVRDDALQVAAVLLELPVLVLTQSIVDPLQSCLA